MPSSRSSRIAIADERGLVVVVAGAHERGQQLAGPPREEPLLEPLARRLEDRVAEVEHRLRRAVVLLEQDDLGVGEDAREVHDVAEVGAAKRVDRLGVVAHHHQVAVLGGEQRRDVRLQPVGVLVLVDHDVAVALRQSAARLVVIGEQVAQPQQQVVVVHHVLLALAGRVQLAELRDRVAIVDEARILRLEQRLERVARVGELGVEVGERVLARKAAVLAVESELGAQRSEQLGRVGAVEDGEAGGVAEPLRVAPQHGVGERVEGAAGDPGAALVEQRGGAPQHLARRAAREGEEEDRLGIDAVRDQPGDAGHQRPRLAGAGARHHQVRALERAHRLELRRVEVSLEVELDGLRRHHRTLAAVPLRSRHRCRVAVPVARCSHGPLTTSFAFLTIH